MKRRVFSMMCALAASGVAHAVYLDPHGMGQVLIYPYYTTNAGQTTLLTVVNTTADGKALKLRFHEGYNGRPVLDLDIYLSPFDVWAGAVAQLQSGSDAPASLLTNDNSCTVPAFAVNASHRTLDFSAASYSGANNDTGPTSGSRTREGHFDVIEMGTVTNASQNTLDAITHSQGVPPAEEIPPGCPQLVTAWAPGGYWAADPNVDLAPPSGGLYGSEAIVDVSAGTMYTVDAAAIDGYSVIPQHTAPGSATPDLDTATESPALSAFNSVTALIPMNGKMLQANYFKPIDAISALFMADSAYNQYETDPATASQTDWVLTFPTKRFYVDPALVGTAHLDVSPFAELFGQTLNGESCLAPTYIPFDREEGTLPPSDPLGPPSVTFSAACFETSVLTVNGAASVLSSSLILPAGGNATSELALPGGSSGHIILQLSQSYPGAALTASTNADIFTGVPVVGFSAINYVNGNVMPGVLSNYNATYMLRVRAACTNSTQPQNACN
jgi:hypothetical protein